MELLLMFMMIMIMLHLNINKKIAGQAGNGDTKDVEMIVPLK